MQSSELPELPKSPLCYEWATLCFLFWNAPLLLSYAYKENHQCKKTKAHVTTKTHCVVLSRVNNAFENIWEPTCPLTITICNQSTTRQSLLSFRISSQFIFWFRVIIWRLFNLKHKNAVGRTLLHVNIIFF